MRAYPLHVERTGDGPPVVLLHGMVSSGRYWQPYIDDLKDDFTVVTVDLLGFGRSPMPKNAEYSLEQHVESVLASLRQAGVGEPFTLVGFSMGAVVALGLADTHPETVGRLLLLSMPIFADATQMKERLLTSGILPRQLLYGRTARMACWLICNQSRPLSQHLMPHYFKWLPRAAAKDILRHNWHSYTRSRDHLLGEQSILTQLRRVEIPVTLMVGRRDSLLKNYEGLDLSGLPGNVLVEYHDTNHQLPFQAQAAVISRIREQHAGTTH